MAKLKLALGKAEVHTPSNREMMPEEWAALCASKIMGVSDMAPAMIRDQAYAFRDQIEHVITHYMREMIRSDRYQLAKNLAMVGHADLAAMVVEQ
jgi:hypothetical protein